MSKAPPASPDTARGQAARASIIAAATDLFAEKGLRATSITDIAARAGVNRAMIAYYFGSKGGLYDAIIDATVEDATASISALDPTGGGRESLRQLVHAFAEINSRRPQFIRMIVYEYFEPGRLFEPSASSRLSGFMKLTQKVLDSVPKGPNARRFDPQVLHLIIVGAINYFILTEPFRQRTSATNPGITTPTMDEFADTLADIFSTGLSEIWRHEA